MLKKLERTYIFRQWMEEPLRWLLCTKPLSHILMQVNAATPRPGGGGGASRGRGGSGGSGKLRHCSEMMSHLISVLFILIFHY